MSESMTNTQEESPRGEFDHQWCAKMFGILFLITHDAENAWGDFGNPKQLKMWGSRFGPSLIDKICTRKTIGRKMLTSQLLCIHTNVTYL
jgi:hypothetical protein